MGCSYPASEGACASAASLGRVRRRPARGVAPGLATALVAAVLAACTSVDQSPKPHPLALAWHDTGLPSPAGERAVVRAATWCAGHWVVVGATATTDGRTRPAVWTSTDAEQWQTMAMHPGHDFYTAQEILESVACSRGRLAVVGSKSGGAHGMPRTASWRERADGSLVAVSAPFALFGGSEALTVGGMAGGPRGYLLAGTRTNGAAVWHSARGELFRLYDGDPGLASTSLVDTQALDAVPYGNRWVVAGEVTNQDGSLRAAVWAADPDTSWTRADLPGASSLSTAERLVVTPAGLDAAGLLDDGIGVWALRNGSWRLTERFGSSAPNGSEPSYVTGLASPQGRLVATYSDGARFRLWVGEDVPMPTEVAVDGDRTATVAAHGDPLLLVTDDDHTGRAWVATIPPPVL